jgi:hypothetical protein
MEFHDVPRRRSDDLLIEIDRKDGLPLRFFRHFREFGHSFRRKLNGQDAVAKAVGKEHGRKARCDQAAESKAPKREGRFFACRSAAEIPVGKKNRS